MVTLILDSFLISSLFYSSRLYRLACSSGLASCRECVGAPAELYLQSSQRRGRPVSDASSDTSPPLPITPQYSSLSRNKALSLY